ncbi:hypothetical protein ABK040_004136 [Willaertia magna]
MQSFMFSTNNSSGMNLNSSQIKEKEWNTLNFPKNCGIVENVVCGSNFVSFRNEKHEVYYFGPLSNVQKELIEDKIEWYKIKKENIKIKNLYANYSELIIQLENDELIINEYTTIITFINIGIKFISCGPLSNHYIVVDKNGKLHYFKRAELNETLIDTTEIKTSIKCIGCSERSNILATIDNKIYVCGDNQFNVQCGLTSQFKFTYLETPFEKESEIVDIKCGFFHTIVLLKNGSVYTVGYNPLGACNVENTATIATFHKLTQHSLFQNEFFIKIQGSSRGTVLITNKNVAYFIGEVVYALTNYRDAMNDAKKSVVGECDDEDIVNYKLKHGNTVQRVKLGSKYNEVVAGGWHYVIYKNVNLHENKSLQYFNKNFKKLINEGTQYYSDISFI